MKCYEVTNCPEERRNACFVYRNFRSKSGGMDGVSCWILKRGSSDWTAEDQAKCVACAYHKATDRDGVAVRFSGGGATVIECEGTLNAQRTKILGEAADRLKAERRGRVILDLSGVTNIYSCAMSMIVHLHLQCEELGGAFVMTGATGYVRAALDTVSFDRFIKSADTIEAALAMLGGSAN